MRPEMVATNSTKSILNIHSDKPSEIKSSVIYKNIEIHDGKTANTKLDLVNPISLDSGDNPFTIRYTDKNGVTNTYDLNLNLPFASSGLYAGNLALEVKQAINNQYPELNSKIIVGSVSNPQDGNLLTFKSFDKENSVKIDLPDSPALRKMRLNTSNNPGVTSGRVRNDQISITYAHKNETDKDLFNREIGFSIGGEQWISKTINVDIPLGQYDVDTFVSMMKVQVPTDVIDNELLISSDSGRIAFSTADRGQQANLTLESRNESYILDDLSMPTTSYHQTCISGSGQQDKTDTFAIEINDQYKEIDLRDEDLSKDDLNLLDEKGIIYTTTGYIIEDPYNPQDYIKYEKVQGTGEIVQLELKEGFYDKGKFGELLEASINGKVNDPNNKVKVTFDYNGNLKITTSTNIGANNSIRFIPPNLANVSNYSPHNTTGEELLHQFLQVTGFDYNRHIGKNGTDKLGIQVGANEGEEVILKVGSVRSGALGIKRLQLTDTTAASQIITKIDKAIEKVSSERTNIGAFQNRFEHIVNIAENSSDNLASAESKIGDADMAKEIMGSSKSQILMQVSQSMIAKANEEPKRILDILK